MYLCHSIFTFYACVDRNDVKKEISIYHKCISDCEHAAQQDNQQECQDSCMENYATKIPTCYIYRRVGDHYELDIDSICIARLKDERAACMEKCKSIYELTEAERRKCINACILPVNPK